VLLTQSGYGVTKKATIFASASNAAEEIIVALTKNLAFQRRDPEDLWG